MKISETELVKACKVGPIWYAAARITNLDGTPVEDATYVTDADGSITFGAAFLTRYDDGCWGYKDIEETGGLVRLSKASLAGSELLSSANRPALFLRDRHAQNRLALDTIV